MILQGNCRSVSIIADIPCFFLFHFHAIRYAFYSIHPTYRMKGTSYSVFTLGSYFGRLRQHDDKRTKPLLRDPL
ncbi:hypothetical protein ACN87_07790 [Escherichia coli]|nr:hypothetical protein ACN87_07790 [Escherichia coli]